MRKWRKKEEGKSKENKDKEKMRKTGSDRRKQGMKLMTGEGGREEEDAG